MKTNRYIGIVMMAAGVLTATSCSDLDDYNTVPSDAQASAGKTLWENISQNENLSDFASLVKKAGFDDELNTSHYYTVWAPKNGTFDAATLMQKDSSAVLKEFVKNHIAEYNHTISGQLDERIHTLNQKAYSFVGAGDYTFDDVKLSQLNLPSSNGVMHVIDGVATFYPNLYEYLDRLQGADSLKTYLKNYELTTLDVGRSVVGPRVNGKQTYIDSVMVTSNTLTNSIGAFIEREDSSYTMIVPGDKAWIAAYNRIKPYFRYIATTKAQDIENATSPTSAPELSVTVSPAYMTDSLTKRSLFGNLIFNNNVGVNRWMEDETAPKNDTLLSEGFHYITNSQNFLSHTTEKIKMSNGFIRLVDSLDVRSWDSWNFEMEYPGYSSLGHIWNGTALRGELHIRKSDIQEVDTTINFLAAMPTSNFARPEVDIKLPRVLSTTYNIYALLVPSSDLKPNQLNFSLSYCNANGALAIQKLNQKVENNVDKDVDTVLVGQFTFPVCYRHLSNTDVCPNLKITTNFNVFDKKAMAKYTRDISLVSIILKPVELDEFEAKK